MTHLCRPQKLPCLRNYKSIRLYCHVLSSFAYKNGIRLKVLTDHSNWEARLGSFDPKWQTGGSAIFLCHFKRPASQDQQKTNSRRLMTFKITLTGQSHFMLIFWLRKVNLRGHTVQYSTVQYSRQRPTPWSHSTRLHQLRTMNVRGHTNSVQWMIP